MNAELKALILTLVNDAGAVGHARGTMSATIDQLRKELCAAKDEILLCKDKVYRAESNAANVQAKLDRETQYRRECQDELTRTQEVVARLTKKLAKLKKGKRKARK